MLLLITGATGFVGGWTVERAMAAGHTVRVLVRDAAKAAKVLPADVEVRLGSLTDTAFLERAMDGTDAVIHAAATYQYGRNLGDQMSRDNPHIARAVLAAAKRGNQPHLIDISSAVVFAPHPDGPLQGVTDIDSPLWPRTDPRWGDPYLSSKVVAYEETLEARAAGMPVTSVHPGMVIGPGDRGPGVSGSALLRFVRDRIFPTTASPWIDVRDLADAIVAMAPGTPGGRIIVANDWIPWRTTAASVDRATGGHRRRVWLPRALIRSMASLNDRSGGRLSPGLPPRASTEWLLGSSGHLDGSTGMTVLGRPLTPLDVTVRDAFAWWARIGVITPAEAGTAG